MNDSENDQALRALAYVVAEIRPDWQVPGILTHLTSATAAGRSYADLCAAAIRCADDPTVRTPAVISMDGRHWRSPQPEPVRVSTVLPPRPAEWCRSHPGQWVDGCAGCRADVLAAAIPAQSIREPRPDADRGSPGRLAARAAVDAL